MGDVNHDSASSSISREDPRQGATGRRPKVFRLVALNSVEELRRLREKMIDKHVRHHQTGHDRVPKCRKIDRLFDSEHVTKEWSLLVDEDAISWSEQKWRTKYGAGNCLVYVYMEGKRFTRPGKTSQHLSGRLYGTHARPTDDEEVFVLAQGLSELGAKLLEACLITCHDIHHRDCRVRCYQYEAVKPPKGVKCAELRAEAVLVLRGLYERIESGEAVPHPKPMRRAQRRSAPVDERAVRDLESYTDDELAAEEKRLEAEKERVDTRLYRVKRLRQERREEEPAGKKRHKG